MVMKEPIKQSHHPIGAHEPSMRESSPKCDRSPTAHICMRQSVQWANIASNNMASHPAKGKYTDGGKGGEH